MQVPTVAEVQQTGVAELRKLLRQLRTTPLPRNDFVVAAGKKVLKAGGLGSELWSLTEQVCIAALSAGEIEYAQQLHAQLVNQFGKDSKRVSRVGGMILEAQERYGEAEAVYRAILDKHPTDKLTVWRVVACRKAVGRLDDAARELEHHLETAHEEQGYLELVALHLAKPNPDYDRALSAIEELLLMGPSYPWLLLYAETLASTGAKSKASMTLARKYYSEAIVQNNDPAGGNNRALWGLWQACSTLKSAHTLSPAEDADNAAVMAWVTKRLKSLYAKQEGPAARAALAVLGEA